MDRASRALAVTALVLALSPVMANAAAPLPAGTAITIRLLDPLSSNHSRTGDRFSFVASEPVVVAGKTVIEAGAKGTGDVQLAGAAGFQGHEGNLHLHFIAITGADGETLPLDFRRDFNGANHKAASTLVGFVPVVGYGAHFLKGEEVVFPANTVLTVAVPSATPTASPSPSPSPSRST